MTRARLLLATAVAALTLLGLAPGAWAADGTLTAVEAGNDTIRGLLTVRTTTPLADARVRATLDGRPVPVDLSDEVRSQRSVMLVIDTSGSMGAAGMATVRESVRSFLAEVPGDVRVGLASFAETSGVDVKPTRDHAAVQQMVDGLAAGGDTDLYGGVAAAVRALADRAGDRSVLLLSDGADTVAARPAEALGDTLAAVSEQEIRLDVVRFNTDDPRAVQALARLTRAGRGVEVAADDPAAVERAFDAAAGALKSQVTFEVPLPDPLAGPTELVLTGQAGAEAFRATATVDPGAVATAPQAGADDGSATAPLGFTVDRQRWWVLPAIGAAAIALATLLLAIAWAFPMRSRKEKRVEQIEGYLPWIAPEHRKSAAEPSAITARLVALSEHVAEERKSTPRIQLLLQRADLPFTVGEWLLVRVLSVLVPPMLGWLVTRSGLAAIVLAVLGLLLPPLVLRFLAARRAVKFERQLPDVLFLVATGLNSGFGLSQAMDGVVRDAPDPVSSELARAQAETRLGTDLPDALERVATRMDSTTMRWTVMAMRIQSEVGGNLAETLRTTAQTLRDRESLKRQVRTLSAEGRLSAYILIALPIGLFFWMMTVNREYLSLLWTTPFGLLMSVVTCVLMVIGIFWMKKVVEVEV